ncbi:glycoside hydrolase family 32 protein [Photobacterium halotolerans]|uniref:Sucrose-6-phosphate hydrolase n=1 Tax=Photobacterium halotolerans TaxID=265726 RepID=A0A0F5VBE6_9GAMM|nr:glycoside hydrolase family 32 protein [Photobacterium halotolerans]KKC99448.1 sucrose-6-phosphate hydrolase [Photobacterium halotolerans]
MSLQSLVDLCGSMDNIARILITDDTLIVEVLNADLVSESGLIEHIGPVQGKLQVTFRRPEDVSEQDLLAVGNLIAVRQQARSEDFARPVPCEFRPSWHISPPQGLLNDPNGFIYHDGRYHLFYQWFPYACTHNDKHWAHLTSPDLINWSWQPIALTPSHWFDSHGAFSGHAISHGGELLLFYTGNTRIGEQRDRQTTQCLATSADGVHFTKHGPVIHALPPGVTPHIRDPKVIRHQDHWLMLLGAQTEDLKGRLAVYQSDDLKQWTFDRLCGEELGDFGYMWECPDYFELGDQHFVVLGPQGIASFSAHNTIPHHNGIAKACWDGQGQLTLAGFQPLDYGFDFYAPQTLLTPDGRRVLCGWMGLPDEVDQPSADNGWVHQLTCMRELTVRDGKLCQWPVREQEKLVLAEQTIQLSATPLDLVTKAFDLSLSLQWGDELRLFQNESQHLVIRADRQCRALILDRCHTLNRAQDTVRELPLDAERVQLRILADTSSVEIFVNGGEAVMSSRVFTDTRATCISLSGEARSALLRTYRPASAPFPS